MKFEKRRLSVVASLVPIIAMNAFASGSATSGGGHGVKLPNGEITFLDLLEDPEVVKKRDIDLFQDPLTVEAAKSAQEFIELMRRNHPEFGAALELRFREMRWSLSEMPLAPIADADLESPQDILVQVARQDAEGKVLMDQRLLERLDQKARSALIVHELLLRKFGRGFPRKTLRSIIRAYFNQSQGSLAFIEETLNSIHPMILEGRFSVQVELKTDDEQSGDLYFYIANKRVLRAWAYSRAYDKGADFGKESQGTQIPVRIEWTAFAGGDRELPGTLKIYVNGVLANSERVVIEMKGGWGELKRTVELR